MNYAFRVFGKEIYDSDGIKVIRDENGIKPFCPKIEAKRFGEYQVVELGTLAIESVYFSEGYHNIHSSKLWIYPMKDGSVILRFHHINNSKSFYRQCRKIIDDIGGLYPVKIACCTQTHLPDDLKPYALFNQYGYGQLYWYKQEGLIKVFYSYG